MGEPTGNGVRLRDLERSHTRIRNRGVWPTTTVYSFNLSRAARLVLAVRGPGPGCELAGRIRIAGRKGLNLFVFDGTIRNRPLPAGTYVLVTTENGQDRVLARSYLTIAAPGSPVAKRVRPKCAADESDAPPPFTGLIGSLLGFEGTGLDAPSGTTGPAATTASDPAETPSRPGGVLGEQTPRTSGLPNLPAVMTPERPSGLLALVLLVLFVGSLIALAVTAVQHMRRQRPLP